MIVPLPSATLVAWWHLPLLALVGMAAGRSRRVPLIYAWLALALTYPLAFHLNLVPVDPWGPQDYVIFLWNFRHARHGFLANGIFAPFGTTLTLHSYAFTYGLLSLPLQLWWPAPEALVVFYNLFLLGGFWLAGWGAHRLAERCWREPQAAWVAGCAYSFCNYHFANVGRLHACCLEWLPWLVLLTLDLAERRRVRDGVLASLVFTGMFLASAEMAVLYAIWLALYLVRHRLPWRPVVWGGLLFIALTAPFWIAWVQEASWHHPLMRYRQADLMDFVRPGVYGMALPLTLLALAAVGLRHSRFWTACAAMFLLLALGPTLHVNGHDTGLPLPFAPLSWLPVIGYLRMAMRFEVVALLALALLAARGAASLKVKWLPPVACFLLLLETCHLPLPMGRLAVSDVYRCLGTRRDHRAVLDLPAQRYRDQIYAVAHQVWHHHPMVQDVAAFLPRVSFEARTAAVADDYIAMQIDLQTEEWSRNPDAVRRAHHVLSQMGVGWIVIRDDWYSHRAFLRVCRNVQAAGFHAVCTAPDAVLYRSP
ncbi:MAG: hypothetical protein ACYCW6_00905 [Candidatus Xenobia bacterium]